MRTASLLRGLAALALLPLSAGCDQYGDDDGDLYGNVVDVVRFTFDVRDAAGGGEDNPYRVSFLSSDIRDENDREAIADVLDEATVEDGMVLLYAEDNLVLGGPPGSEPTTWQILPHTEAFESVNNGTPYVDYTLTYTYSFDAGDGSDDGSLFFDIISSAPLGRASVVTFLEDHLQANQIEMKLVAIPGELYAESGLAAADLRDYEKVRRAFSLAD